MSKQILVLLAFMYCALSVKAQYISVSDYYTDQQLVQKIFDTNSCVTPTNIKITGHTFSDNSKSYGYFSTQNSTFPLTEGIIITTGKAKSAQGPNNTLLSEGPRSWPGDQDLERAINETNTFNATSIEFEIVAVSSQFSFDYIFSSEQYLSNPANYQCNYSDGFAFLIKEINEPDANYENVAVIPNTTIPIKIPTVRAATRNCPESYAEYFNGFNGSNHPTNYNGQTITLTAKADVTPGKKYNFKLVIADQGNEQYDSAIFLSAGSFKNGIDLGVPSEFKICNNQNLFITPTPLPNAQYYTWFKDGIVISNHDQINTPDIEISQPGTYKLEAYINVNCIITEEIVIDHKPGVTIANETHKICSFYSEPQPFNIITNNNLGFNNHMYDYLSFHYSAIDAANGTNAIPNTTLQNFLAPNGATVLYTRGYDFKTDCSANGTYTIINSLGAKNLPEQNICNYNNQSYNITAYLPYTNISHLDIYDNIYDTNSMQNRINIDGSANIILKPGENIFYILYRDNLGCGEKFILKINVLQDTLPNEYITFCEGSTALLVAPAGYTNYSWSTGEVLPNIQVTTNGVYTLTLKTAANCTFIKKYIVTKINKPSIFNESVSLCTFTASTSKEINIKAYTEKYITVGSTFKMYESLTDLYQEINPLEKVFLDNNIRTFYVKEVNTKGCFSISQISFRVNFPSFLPNESFCQLNNQPIDISELINDIKNNYPNKHTRFYTNSIDAENNTNELLTFFINNTVQNIYVAVIDTDASCYQNLIIPININSVNDLPSENKTICKNESILLTGPSGNYSYNWNTGETTSSIYINSIGTYTVTITNDFGCTFKKTFNIKQSEPAKILDIKINQFANIKNSITVLVSGAGHFEYSLNGFDYQESNLFTLVKPGEYTVYVKDTNGCGVTTQKIIVVDIPNFFTPNNDGVNDTWNVKNLFITFPDAEIYIVDRYGKLITYLYSNRPEWDGVSFGKKQPSTDYWYVIKLNNGNTYKGHFSLKK